MNEIVNKLLLKAEKHLKQPGSTYDTCGLFTKIKERIKNLKKQKTQCTFINTNLHSE